MSEPWRDSNNVVKAWKRCLGFFVQRRPPGFCERVPSGALTKPLAFNWSFGALLSAFAACQNIPSLRDEMAEDLPFLRKVHESYFDSRHQAFRSTPLRWKGDIYFDDNAWIALAAIDIFRMSGQNLWIDDAMKIYRFILKEGYDPGSGGVYWRMHPKSSLHVCSAGPTALLGAKLMQLGESVPQDPIDKMIEWCWQMRDSRGVFRDHYNLITRRIDSSVYTYNTGTPLHAVMVMAEILPKEAYDNMAQDVLASAPALLPGHSLPATPWFNAVLLRALEKASRRYSQEMLSPLLDPYRRDMSQSWKRFESTDQPLVLPSSERKPGILLRDAASSVETLALLHQIAS